MDSEKHIADIDRSNSELKIDKIHGSNTLAQARLASPPNPFSKNILLLFLACIPAYLCGTMSGYDGSVMGSFLVEKPFDDLFGANVVGFKAGLITAMYQIGTCTSILFIGESLDRFGRRFGVFIGCIIAIIGVVVQGTSAKNGSLGAFMAGRFFLGFGANIAQAAASTYVVEISHPAYRGFLTGGQNSTMNIGSLFAACVTFGTRNVTGNGSWLIPTYSQLVCPGIACLFVFFFPESPRWLYTHGKVERAKNILIKYHGEGNEENPYVRLQLQEFEEQLDLNGADKRWWDYRVLYSTRSQRYRVANSVLIGIWGSLSSGGLSYFVGAFFKSAGITNTTTVLRFNIYATFMGACAGYIGSVLTDYIGRRTLLLPTLGSMALCWFGLAAGTACVEQDPTNSSAGKAGIAFFFLIGFIYCIGITPLQGVYTVEVFSFDQRAKGVGFKNFVINAVALINQFATPVAIGRIKYKFYLIVGSWVFIELIVSYLIHVETNGYTLEELNAIFESKNPRKASTKRRKVIIDNELNLLKVEAEENA